MNFYEQDRTLNLYLLFHYGTREEILAGSPLEEAPGSWEESWFRFPAATVEETFKRGRTRAARALDLGCAVGRSSFELSRRAEEVVGIDWSSSFIEAAEALADGRALRYRRYREAHQSEELIAAAPADCERARVRFEAGDAMDLRPDLGVFDLVHAANLLCRLSRPRRLLDRLPALVKPGGQLVLATPATWLEDYTPRAEQPLDLTLNYLQERLGASFKLLGVKELPFVIREHARKFQLSTSQTTLWRRK